MNGHLAAYRRHLRDLGRADSTVEGYLELLTRMDRELPQGLTRACEDELREWINADGHGRATRNWYRTVVCGFFAWCCDPDEPRLDFNPARRLPRGPQPRYRPRPVPVAQLLDIFARARQPYRDWFLLARRAGARCTEIAAMDREDITRDHVRLHGKGGFDRYVPTHDLVWELAQSLPPGPVARDTDGSRLTRQQISHRGNYRLTMLGHPDVSMHRLRHTFATAAYDEVKDLVAVQELMGHASPATTAIYVAVNEASKRRAVLGSQAVA
jgi:integrase/recombinase XerC